MTDVYIASNMPTDYPRKLQKPSTVNERVRDTAETFIMDSGIGDDVSNETVLDLAHEYDADFVVAKDYLWNQPKTTDSVRDFIAFHRQHPCDATPMIPLQPPHAAHYEELPHYDHYVLGGMATQRVSTQQAIRWIREFRRVAPDVYAHGLGVGGGVSFIQQATAPSLLDSIDCSTPELAASFGAVLCDELKQKEVRLMNGDGAAKRNVPLAEFNSWQVQDVWDEYADREGMQGTMNMF